MSYNSFTFLPDGFPGTVKPDQPRGTAPKFLTYRILHFPLLCQNKNMSAAEKLAQMNNDKAAANLEAGEQFLAQNGTRPEVTTTASGLQYEVLQEGTGPKPKATDTVKCHYHGTLISGTMFDSSVQRGQPASFPLNRVISGWTEALQLMPTGSKWRLFLHPSLGYGNRQVSAAIGPNSTLIFDVELLDIV
jgi:FKBP-type peptidyl-prolyl cis-trans isomerase FklB